MDDIIPTEKAISRLGHTPGKVYNSYGLINTALRDDIDKLHGALKSAIHRIAVLEGQVAMLQVRSAE